MFTFTTFACSIAMDWLLHSFRPHMHKPPVKFPISSFHFSNIFRNSPTSKTSCTPMTVNWNFYPEPPLNKLLNLNQKPLASTISLTQNATKDETPRKVKLLCRFGGKIVANSPNADPHYVGGKSRIIAIRRDATFDEFYCKMKDAYGGPLRIFYQLPKHSLDFLISIYSIEDFENMMEEIDNLSKASKASNSGSPKLRVFLFPFIRMKDPLDRFNVAASNNCAPSYIKKNDQVIAPKIKDTNKLGNQHQQPVATTCNSYSLFSDQDPRKILGLQLSNINKK